MENIAELILVFILAALVFIAFAAPMQLRWDKKRRADLAKDRRSKAPKTDNPHTSSHAYRSISRSVVMGLMRLNDIVAVGLSGLLAYYARYGTIGLNNEEILFLVLTTLLSANVFQIMGVYRFSRVATDPLQFRRMSISVLIIIIADFMISKIGNIGNNLSAIWILTWAVMALITLSAVRAYFMIRLSVVQSKGFLTRRVAIFGAGPQGQRMAEYLQNNPQSGITLVGVYDERETRVPRQILGYPLRSGMGALLKDVRKEGIDEIILALPWSAEDRLLKVLKKLRSAQVEVHLCPDGVAFQFHSRAFSSFLGINVLTVFDQPATDIQRSVKSFEDRFLATLILIFLAPLFAGIAIAIKLDSPGPVFERRRRVGFNVRAFYAYSFRTLTETEVQSSKSKHPSKSGRKTTAFGAFLRSTGLSELPQFVNVLRGEMSVVGPRYLDRRYTAGGEIYDLAVQEYFVRHRIKPGMTGWAQVNGIQDDVQGTDMLKRRLEYDFQYIEQWSLWLDLKILIMVPFSRFQRKNAS